jgi:hypothetical protein
VLSKRVATLLYRNGRFLLSVFVKLELCALGKWNVWKKVRRVFSPLVISIVVLFLSRVVRCDCTVLHSVIVYL